MIISIFSFTLKNTNLQAHGGKPMRITKITALLLIALVALSVSAKPKTAAAPVKSQSSADNTTADSMDYDFKIEWKCFSNSEPIKAFDLTQKGVWYLTGSAEIGRAHV
jgi:hypothetical protein